MPSAPGAVLLQAAGECGSCMGSTAGHWAVVHSDLKGAHSSCPLFSIQEMGNSYAGQLRTTRFEEVLHNSIEASLRSNTVIPRPVFSQLYLEPEQRPLSRNGQMENEEEDEEDCSDSNSPPIPYQMKPPPEGSCTTDGFCQAGKDLRLASLASECLDVPPGFLLVGAKSPSIPDHILVCAVDRRFLPDERGRNALLGFLGNCMGCGEKGFRYFTEFSNHINLKLTTQPKKQKHLKYRLLRNAQGVLVKGPPICWKGIDSRVRQTTSNVSGGLDELPPGSGASDLLQNPGHVGLNTASYTVHLKSFSWNYPVHLKTIQSGIIQSTLTPSRVELYRRMEQLPYPAVELTEQDLNTHLQASDTSPHMTNGGHIPVSQQPLPQPGLTAHGPGRPTVTGTMANSGPPKKRHKGWSPESSAPTEAVHRPAPSTNTVNGTRSDNVASGCVSQGSSPPLPPGESVTVPEGLLQTCGLQPVIFKGHGALPCLCGNTGDVLVNGRLQACYRSSQTLPRVYEQYGASPVQPLSTEMQVLLTVYYLVQLAPDQMPLMEDLEQILMRSWRESHLTEIRQYQQSHPQFPTPLPGLAQPLTPSQLPWLAKLATSSSGESVLVLDTAPCLAEALDDTFQKLMEGKLRQTHYVVIICMGRSQETESCIVVTGKHQSRALAEGMLSPSDCVREINQELSSGMTAELEAYFSSLGPDADVASLEKASPENTSPSAQGCVQELSGEPTCTEYRVEWREVRPIQLAVARKLLSHVCAIADSSTHNLDLGSFDKVEFLICVPPSEVAFQQVVLHLWNSGVLQELGLDQDCLSPKQAEQYVVKLDQAAVAKISGLIQKSKLNPYTLFILVHDHAHWDISSGQYSRLGGEPMPGLVDSLLNCRQIQEAANILTLHVTSFPFALQTQYTRISPYNEIHWPSAFNNDVDLYQEKTKYFGVSELLESTRSGNGLPLLRFDSSFESMVAALEERFPKLHSVVIRTQVLLQHYSVALMATAKGQAQLQKHTSVETLEMVQCLLDTAHRCPNHHGHMLLLRIPFPALAALAHQRLCRVRDRLGLHERFEVVLGDPTSGIVLGKHFLNQLRLWLKIQDPEWTPHTYLELEALPCILIFTGMNPMGESLPRSLKYCDQRVMSCCSLQRTALEQELGLAAYLVSAEQQSQRGARSSSDLSESDPDKLSSTDNEEEELVVDVNSTLLGPDHPQTDFSPHKPDKLPPQQPSVTGDTPHDQRRSSKSTSPGCSSTQASPLRQCCSWARNLNRPPVVLLPRALYDLITTVDASGLPKPTSFLPHASVEWASSFRPLLSKMMTCTEQSLYYRQWTVPRPHHMDSSNRAEGRTDNFHPRRLLLSGPPQVGKTGAYLQFLGILSRMLIRLMEVDIYDEEDINCNPQSDLVRYHQAIASWPNADTMRGMPFDFTIHDPKYEDISAIYSPDFTPNVETVRVRGPPLHAFTFLITCCLERRSSSMGFIIPKIQKSIHFSFSQPGGQLESMRLPLTSDWSAPGPHAIRASAGLRKWGKQPRVRDPAGGRRALLNEDTWHDFLAPQWLGTSTQECAIQTNNRHHIPRVTMLDLTTVRSPEMLRFSCVPASTQHSSVMKKHSMPSGGYLGVGVPSSSRP
ncbi:hypothetical protein NFI96_007870, partial [Prochilodus magdalenae]